MMKVYYEKDADLSLIKGKKVTIVGYGSQGHAHAQNLNDSGVKVTVGLRKGGASWDKAKKAGLKVAEVGEAVKGADFVMMLMPDEHIAAVYTSDVEPNIKKGATLAFAHGFNIHYGQVHAARRPRRRHDRAEGARATRCARPTSQGGGVPMLIAVHQDASKQGARPRAVLRGGDRRRARRRHRDQLPRRDRDRPLRRADRALRRLRRADQGGLRDAGRGRLRAGDGVLRMPARAEADRRPDLRGRHRQHELLDLEQRRVRRVRDAARRSSPTRRKKAMREVLARIQTGEYAKDFILENRAGAPTLLSRRRMTAEHPIEEVGEKLRAMMPWIKKNKLVDQTRN